MPVAEAPQAAPAGAEEAPRFDSLQVFRGLSAVAVVLYHIYYFTARDHPFTYNLPWAEHGKFGVDFFFVLSGFIVMWIHAGDIGDRSSLRTYAVKRFIRIYPLMWLVVAPKFLVLFFAPSLLNSLTFSPELVVSSLLLWPSPSLILEVQWTLVYEILFYIIFGLWIFLGRRLALAAAALWLIAILAIKAPAGNVWAEQILSPLNLEFLMGCGVALALRRARLTAGMARGLLLAAPLAAAAYFYAVEVDRFVFSAAAAAVIAAAVSLDRLRAVSWPRALVLLGDASYSIYLTHTTALMVFFLVGRKLHWRLDAWGQLPLHLAGAGAVLAGLIFYQIVEKPLLKWMRGKLRLRAGRRGREGAGLPPTA